VSEAAFTFLKKQRKEDQMPHRTSLFVISLLILAVLGLTSLTASTAFTGASAQSAQGDQTLQALLGEVHQLRLALQRANLNTYHAQITIERMKLQQQRVDRLQTQLGEGRNQLASTRKVLSDISRALKGNEMGLAQETNAAERADRERYAQRLKAELEELTQKEQQEQGYETQLQAQLQIEQAKLSELNERLDSLQRELEAQMSTDKPQPSGKRPEKD
jgi:chromosome segregation ATPase